MSGSLIQKGEKEEMIDMTMWKKWFLLGSGVVSSFIINNLEVKAEATEEYSYEIKDDGTIKLTEYLGNSEYVEVPETIDGIPTGRKNLYFFNCLLDGEQFKIQTRDFCGQK